MSCKINLWSLISLSLRPQTSKYSLFILQIALSIYYLLVYVCSNTWDKPQTKHKYLCLVTMKFYLWFLKKAKEIGALMVINMEKIKVRNCLERTLVRVDWSEKFLHYIRTWKKASLRKWHVSIKSFGVSRQLWKKARSLFFLF